MREKMRVLAAAEVVAGVMGRSGFVDDGGLRDATSDFLLAPFIQPNNPSEPRRLWSFPPLEVEGLLAVAEL